MRLINWIHDRIEYRGYSDGCRFCQRAMPRDYVRYEPLPFREWRSSPVFVRRNWKHLFFPGKIGS